MIREVNMELQSIMIEKEENVNVIIGQSHFIKTVEDLYETVVAAVPGLKFGLAFNEASGACKVRMEGNDDGLKQCAAENALRIGAGHVFVLMLKEGFPINILNQIKTVGEVCSIFAATANPLEIIVVDNGQGRGILGVIDGAKPKGLEDEADMRWRKEFLRKIGYKR